MRQLEATVGAPRFRVWIYRSPAIVLGSAQRALRDRLERSDAGVALLDRFSGGGAVLTGPWMVSTSVALPYGHSILGDGLIGCYRWLGLLHVDVLREFGIRAYALPPRDLPDANARVAVPALDWACFGSLSPWEVVDKDCRKLVGLAQRRRQTGVLLVAGLLVAPPDWRLLCNVMGQAEDEPILRRRTVSCQELCGCVIVPERLGSVLTHMIDLSLDAKATGNERKAPAFE